MGLTGSKPVCRQSEKGSATVEQIGLLLMLAALIVAALVAIAGQGEIEQGRQIGSLLGRRIACAPLAGEPCHRDRLAVAYGEPLARLVRMLAPRPDELRRDGLVAVDFRYCRRAGCAVPAAGERGERLTESNRRLTAFTEVHDRRRTGDGVEVIYWLYRPGQPWQPIRRPAGADELAAARAVPLGRDESPILVPLETLPGRNHYRFRRAEEPPWRWRVAAIYPGRPS